MSTIYLSGPMTGLPDLNYPAFHAAAESLRAEGHVVYNPADWEYHGVPHQQVHEFSIRRTFNLRLAFIDYCEFIIRNAEMVVVLPGWTNSPGATAEAALARAIGLPVRQYEDGVILEVAVPPACENHNEAAKRDGNPPWCSWCGWRHEVKAEPARKIGPSAEEKSKGAKHLPWTPKGGYRVLCLCGHEKQRHEDLAVAPECLDCGCAGFTLPSM